MSIPLRLLSNPEAGSVELARYLSEGSLVLLVGAGISKGVGLPVWWELVRRCLRLAGCTSDARKIRKSTSNERLRVMVDNVERSMGEFRKYRDAVKRSLYAEVDFSREMLSERLLISLGALLMGSRRGRIQMVINFNFDDVLEWYLRLHGLRVQVVSRIPTLLRDADVIVYHPHGFLPKMSEKDASDFLILGQYSYDKKLGATRDLWMEFTKQVLRERVGLFVGLSGKDPTVGPMLADIKESVGTSRPTGFWLFGPDEVEVANFEQRNIVPIKFPQFEQIPDFLLRICQLAAGD